MKFNLQIKPEKYLSFPLDKRKKLLFLLIKEIENSDDIYFSVLKKHLIDLLNLSSEPIPQNIIPDLIQAQNKRIVLSLTIPFFEDLFFNEKDFHFLNHKSINIKQNDSDDKKRNFPLILILHQLRSAFNVGSIIRSAECFGIEKLYFTDYTPLPTNPKVIQTSMNSSYKIKWEKSNDIFQLISDLKDRDYTIFALETADPSVNIDQYLFSDKCALILGNEALGIDHQVLDAVDHILEIPLFGWKNSLNVGAAAAIACYEITKQLNNT